MTAFWALAARDWPPSYPTHELVAAVGAERVAELHDAGVLRHEAIRPYGTVTCRECRRDARVIYEAGGAVAICTGDFGCPDEELGPAPSRSAMHAGELARRLASALQLDGAPGREALVTPLGRRRIGDEDVSFDLCSHPGRPEALEALAACARRGPEVRVVLVPCSRRLRADAPAEVGGAEIVWVGLDEVVRLGGALAVDLRPVLARRRFRGAVAEPTFDGLLVEERGAAWCGRRVLGSDEGRAMYVPRFDEVLKFHAPGLAPVRDGSGAYHIDAEGRPVYASRFRRTFGFYEGLAAVVTDAGWAHIRADGSPITDSRWAWAGNFQGGRCPVRDQNGRYGHLDAHGRRVYGLMYRYAGDYRDGVAVVQRDDGLSTHVDVAGGEVHGRWFEDLDVFHKGFARARDLAGWMHVDRLGRSAYSRRFAAVEPFYNGQARVERFDGALEVIDEGGGTLLVLRSPASRPNGRPRKLLLIGLPGAGKTTLAALLGPRLGLPVVRLDALRATHADGTIAGDYLARAVFLRACASETSGLYEFGATGHHRIGVRQAFREAQSRLLTIWVDTPTPARRARLTHRDTHVPLPDWGIAPGTFDDAMERKLRDDFASGFWSDAGWSAVRVDGTLPVMETLELATAAWAAMEVG